MYVVFNKEQTRILEKGAIFTCLNGESMNPLEYWSGELGYTYRSIRPIIFNSKILAKWKAFWADGVVVKVKVKETPLDEYSWGGYDYHWFFNGDYDKPNFYKLQKQEFFKNPTKHKMISWD